MVRCLAGGGMFALILSLLVIKGARGESKASNISRVDESAVVSVLFKGN